MSGLRSALLLATAIAGTAAAQPALAQDAGRRIDAIQNQILQLQQELRQMRRELSARNSQARAPQGDNAKAQPAQSPGSAQPAQGPGPSQALQANPSGAPNPQTASSAGGQGAGTTGPSGAFRVGGVTVTLGGFLAAEGLYRTRNITSDMASTYTGIPLPNSPNYHTGEFRGSARQSRLSLLAEGQIAPGQAVAGYFESDFLGVGTTSNSNESNSYVPRLRQAYLTYDNTSLGVHALAGQSWSLLTLNRVGITPRQESIPLTIDAQYVPGFNWKRQWQLRVDRDMFNHRLWLGASLEEPQTVYYTGPNGLGVLSLPVLKGLAVGSVGHSAANRKNLSFG